MQQAIQKTEKAFAGKKPEEVVTPDLIFAASGIMMDDEDIAADCEDEADRGKVIDIVETMIAPMDSMPTRSQFDAFVRIEEHNEELYAIFEESELYEDGAEGKYLIADIRMLIDIPKGFSEDILGQYRTIRRRVTRCLFRHFLRAEISIYR